MKFNRHTYRKFGVIALGCLMFHGVADAAAPTGVKGRSFTPNSVKLIWTGSEDATEYWVQRSSDGTTFQRVAIVPAGTEFYIDETVSASAPYLYRVVGRKGGISETSDAVGVATLKLPNLSAITADVSGKITSQYAGLNNNENTSKLIDGSVDTKYLFNKNSGWVKYEFPQGAVVTQYSIVSGNDASERDPKNWVLEGSNDNSTWSELDSRNYIAFPGRKAKLHYAISNTKSYKYYRLNIKSNNGGSMTQMAEFTLYADCEITRNDAVPATPSNFKFLSEMSSNGEVQIMPSSNQIILTWSDASDNEDYFVIERSTDNATWDWSTTVDRDNTRYRAVCLTPETHYYFRIKAVNDIGSSDWVSTDATTMNNIPAETINEDWDVHRATLRLQYYDDDIAIYYDDDMDKSITWPKEVFGDIWRYCKKVYGDYSDPRLEVYFHAGKYSGGHPSTWSRADHHYKNILDLGTGAGTNEAWQSYGGNNLDLPVHEIGHIMEGASLHVHGSPERVVWGDSKYAEIFNYDVYVGCGLTDQAERWKKMQMENNDSSTPAPGIYWFRDFYYPIYSQYGGSKLLADFFVYMKKLIPQKNGDYTRDMNMGEFIHCYSAAAGVNLKSQATVAFGWKDEWEFQLTKAQAECPFDYKDPDGNVMEGGAGSASIDANSAENGVENLFDKNEKTFYEATRTSEGETFDIFFSSVKPVILSGYSLTCGSGTLTPPADWTLSVSEDGEQWKVVDTQSGQIFSKAYEEKSYDVTVGDAAYNKFKLSISKLRLGNKITLSEWELRGTLKNIPTAPVGLKLTEETDGLLLQWSDYSIVNDAYVVESSTKAAEGFGELAKLNANQMSYLDTNPLEEDATRYYRVKALGGEAESEYSDVVSTEILGIDGTVTDDADFRKLDEFPGNRVYIYNINGSVVYSGSMTYAKWLQFIQGESGLSGIYLYQIILNSSQAPMYGKIKTIK
ncbi:fibronectin type III domain-containing protein [Coprobacter tertius]|uniref:Fibronectin type III domain-containing protein n=1 Tax=Coprobacter tertius TaxID=2944915 RepID=A0ABT1MFS8_9BACT|nr:fibronectin type III domain-containing protein [Coprobacter tertius]MCP9611490.1 fibronectin type III domain-containing protein [Coprobacter tertius]